MCAVIALFVVCENSYFASISQRAWKSRLILILRQHVFVDTSVSENNHHVSIGEIRMLALTALHRTASLHCLFLESESGDELVGRKLKKHVNAPQHSLAPLKSWQSDAVIGQLAGLCLLLAFFNPAFCACRRLPIAHAKKQNLGFGESVAGSIKQITASVITFFSSFFF